MVQALIDAVFKLKLIKGTMIFRFCIYSNAKIGALCKTEHEFHELDTNFK
jgi:hypothetical protein